MKNTHAEQLKLCAKQYHRTRRGDHFEDGMMIFHVYDGLPLERLSWWDDVTFIMNDYRVALAWHHPRMAYEDEIDAEADRRTADLPYESFRRDGTPIYKAVGNSRKKIQYTTYEPLTKADRRDQWERARQQVLQSVDVQVEPSLNSRWCKYSRLVKLCAPIEVRNKNDLRQLVGLTTRLLKREITLQDVFPNYRYTRADWEREGLHVDGADLHAHRVTS